MRNTLHMPEAPAEAHSRTGLPARQTPAGEETRTPCMVFRDSRFFLEVSRIVKLRLELEEVLGPLAEYMVRKLGFERVSVRVADPSRGMIENAFDRNGDSGARVAEVPGMTELRGWVERTAKPAVTLWDMENGPGITLLCVPILADQRVIGAVCAQRLIEDRKPAHEDLKALVRVAAILTHGVRFRRFALGLAEEMYRENAALREYIRHHFRPAGLAGDSAPMQTVYYKTIQAAPLEIPVLIRGERGSGRKSIARVIHGGSSRSGHPLVEVDCVAIREPGALEGALAQARGGSLYLEEIEALAAPDQARLLQVIRDAEADERWGRESAALDVRLICSSSDTLEERVRAGRFDRELFLVLSTYSIRVPSLRERRSDLLPLAICLMEKLGTQYHRKIRRISPAAVDLLLAYDWPGNVAEMEAVFEEAVGRCGGEVLRANHFPSRLYAAMDPQGARLGALDGAMAALEYELVVDALIAQRGNIAAAARQLGTTERIMGCRVKKYGLDMTRFTHAQAA